MHRLIAYVILSPLETGYSYVTSVIWGSVSLLLILLL